GAGTESLATACGASLSISCTALRLVGAGDVGLAEGGVVEPGVCAEGASDGCKEASGAFAPTPESDADAGSCGALLSVGLAAVRFTALRFSAGTSFSRLFAVALSVARARSVAG